MPYFESIEEYRHALADLGVTKVDYEELVKASKRRLLANASREHFEQFLEAHGLTTWPWMHRNQFLGYAGPKEQGLWCTWCDALCLTPKAHLELPGVAVQLFCIEMAVRGYKQLTPEGIASRQASADVLLRWDVWNAALRFWDTVSAQHKLEPLAIQRT